MAGVSPIRLLWWEKDSCVTHMSYYRHFLYYALTKCYLCSCTKGDSRTSKTQIYMKTPKGLCCCPTCLKLVLSRNLQNLWIRRTYYTGEVPKDRANVPVMGQCFSSATRRGECRPMLPVSTNGEYHVELGNKRSVRGKFKPLKGLYLGPEWWAPKRQLHATDASSTVKRTISRQRKR